MSEQPGEKSIADKMEGAGKATSSAGCGITGFVFALFIVVLFGFLLSAVAC